MEYDEDVPEEFIVNAWRECVKRITAAAASTSAALYPSSSAMVSSAPAYTPSSADAGALGTMEGLGVDPSSIWGTDEDADMNLAIALSTGQDVSQFPQIQAQQAQLLAQQSETPGVAGNQQ